MYSFSEKGEIFLGALIFVDKEVVEKFRWMKRRCGMPWRKFVKTERGIPGSRGR